MSIDALDSTNENNSEKEEQYYIAKYRLRRNIRPLQRYSDLLGYTLYVAEEIDGVAKPNT